MHFKEEFKAIFKLSFGFITVLSRQYTMLASLIYCVLLVNY